MQSTYRVPEQPTTPPEPTAADLAHQRELDESRRLCRQSHIDRLRHCLAHGLSVRVGSRTDQASALLVSACDYRNTEEAASQLAQRAAAFDRDPSEVGQAYADLLELQLGHTADDMMQAVARGEAVEYGVEAASAARHTPGPWKAVQFSGKEKFAIGPLVSSRVADAYGDANARLIAAAPDLLLACQGLLESAETGITSLGVIRGAHAAIAKATGVRS